MSSLMNDVLDKLQETMKQRLWKEQAMNHPLGVLVLALEEEVISWDLKFVVDESGCLCYGSGKIYETELPAFHLLKTMSSFVNSLSNRELERHGNELWSNLIVVSEEFWYDVSQNSVLNIRRQVLDMVSLETHAQAVKDLAFRGDYTSPSEGIQKELRMKVLLG